MNTFVQYFMKYNGFEILILWACSPLMKELWKHYSHGNITKEDLDATLRSHQAALDAMKSEQRDIADYL